MRSTTIRNAGMALVLLSLGVKVALTRVPRVAIAGHQIHGAYHVHSTLSDGRGTPDEIAAAAAKDGLDFVVLTDHNRLDPQLLGVRDGVLMIPATEESTPFGHVVSLGAKRALGEDEKKAGPLAAIRSVGGAPMIAHPMNRRMPWSGDFAGAQGFEVFSYDDMWREALRAPGSRGLVSGVFELPFNPKLAAAQILRRPDAALAKYDELRKEQPLALLCADDAHGWPGYESGLGLMSMYLDDVRDAKEPLASPAALSQGRGYCALDVIAPAPGFSFTAAAKDQTPIGEGQEGPWTGRTLRVTLPAGSEALSPRVHIYRDGFEISTGALELAVDRPGDYRVEVWVPFQGAFTRGEQLPWILSNPIRLK